MKKTFKISISCLAIGGFLLGGQLLLAALSITVNNDLNFGAYTVTPIQLNQGENIECDLKPDDTTECENATPYGSFAQVGVFKIRPQLQTFSPLGGGGTDYSSHAFIKVSYRKGSLDLEEAGVALELRFHLEGVPSRVTLKRSTGKRVDDVAALEVFKPLESPVSWLIFSDSRIQGNRQEATKERTIKVYGKLIVEDPVKFFAYRTKHNIKDAKLLGALNFLVYDSDDIQKPRSDGGFRGTIPHTP